MEGPASPIPFLNVEYFFRLIYNARPDDVQGSFVGLSKWFLEIWTNLGAVSFVFSLAALGLLAYSTIRMRQILTHEHHERYSDLDPIEAEQSKDHSRWAHIQTLIESGQERDWREAIMEADIMLEDMLVERGYEGTSTGERLQRVDPKRFTTLDQAWEAHKIRNRIAHEGMAFKLEDQIAYRTIKKYEAVFKEFAEI